MTKQENRSNHNTETALVDNPYLARIKRKRSAYETLEDIKDPSWSILACFFKPKEYNTLHTKAVWRLLYVCMIYNKE